MWRVKSAESVKYKECNWKFDSITLPWFLSRFFLSVVKRCFLVKVAVNCYLLWAGCFGLLSSPVELISAATKGVWRQRWEPSLVEFHKHMCSCTHIHRNRNTPKGWRDVFKVISHFSSLSLLSYSLWILLPQTASCASPLPAEKRSHVEKRRSTCDTISKWLAPQQAPSRPVYLDEVVHCTLSAYGL